MEPPDTLAGALSSCAPGKMAVTNKAKQGIDLSCMH